MKLYNNNGNPYNGSLKFDAYIEFSNWSSQTLSEGTQLLGDELHHNLSPPRARVVFFPFHFRSDFVNIRSKTYLEIREDDAEKILLGVARISSRPYQVGKNEYLITQ